MGIWFEGSNQIECDLQQILRSLENYGDHLVGVIGLMPGLTTVELANQGNGFATIQTNEGIMKRTNITKHAEADRVVIDFDEEYQTKTIVVQSHHSHEFVAGSTAVAQRVVISDVVARGVLGFFYRHFGKSNIGKAILTANKTFFEEQSWRSAMVVIQVASCANERRSRLMDAYVRPGARFRRRLQQSDP